MAKKDPRVDAYIEKSPDYAKPILKHLRTLVHKGCPEVVETIKWSRPHFEHQGVMCGMVAFKEYCVFGFWKPTLLKIGGKPLAEELTGMGQFGRIASVKDLPGDATIVNLVKQAAKLNEDGVTPERAPRTAKGEVKVPDYFMAAIRKNKKALAAFDAFPPSHRREYVEWITEAKGDDTRQRRIASALEWMAEGKPRNWKYAR